MKEQFKKAQDFDDDYEDDLNDGWNDDDAWGNEADFGEVDAKKHKEVPKKEQEKKQVDKAPAQADDKKTKKDLYFA